MRYEILQEYPPGRVGKTLILQRHDWCHSEFFLPYCPCSRRTWSPYPPPTPPPANVAITGNLRGQFPPTLMDLYPKHLRLSARKCPPDTGACSACVLGRLGVAERDILWSNTQPVRSENGWPQMGKLLGVLCTMPRVSQSPPTGWNTSCPPR